MSLQDNILNVLEKHGPSARDYLTMILERPRTTIYDELRKLEKLRLVSKFTRPNGKRGRDIVLWKIGEA